jgi:hypothetical protein
MMTKLTLRVDKILAAKAKQEARHRASQFHKGGGALMA